MGTHLVASLFNLPFSLRGGAWCFLLYSLWQLSASSANCFEAETDRRDRGTEKEQGDKRPTTLHSCPPSPVCLVPVTHWLLQGLNAHTNSTLMQPDKEHEQELLFISLTTAAVWKSPETNMKKQQGASFTLFPFLSHVC